MEAIAPSRILIVDDTSVGRETLGALLMDHGYELVFAVDGPHALGQAAELLPDLILLDVMMPGMDGYEVCQRLRATTDLAEVPIILVTTLDDRESRIRGIEAGADDFISKPFDRLELRARVRAITRLNRYRRLMEERTQRQQAEQSIEHQNQILAALQEANVIKSKFISDVAHELRTPLTVMTLTSGNLETLYDQLDDVRRKKLIRQVGKQVIMLNELVDGVLDLARLDGSTATGDTRQMTDLAALAREEVERQIPLALQKSQTLHVDGPRSLPVRAHEGQLRRILANLLNNAVKYTPEQGKITCECRQITVPDEQSGWPGEASLPTGQWAALQVVDTGIGIASNDLTRIFERFYRVNTQGNIPGTGLGLAITQELIQRHQGHIAVSSIPGAGSRFAFYLPML